MRFLLGSDATWGVGVFDALRALVPADWELVQSHDALVSALADAPVPEAVFFVNWERKVPADIVGAFRCVNLHATPLPYGRGANPIEHMLMRGHSSTVVTAHEMTEGIDAGEVLCQSGLVSLAGTKDDILGRLVTPCATLVLKVITRAYTPRPQQGPVVPFRRLTESECERFWEGRS